MCFRGAHTDRVASVRYKDGGTAEEAKACGADPESDDEAERKARRRARTDSPGDGVIDLVEDDEDDDEEEKDDDDEEDDEEEEEEEEEEDEEEEFPYSYMHGIERPEKGKPAWFHAKTCEQNGCSHVPRRSRRVIISNLPPPPPPADREEGGASGGGGLDRHFFEMVLGQVGLVKSLKLAREPAPKGSKGSKAGKAAATAAAAGLQRATVVFANASQAQAAVAGFDGVELLGRPMRVVLGPL